MLDSNCQKIMDLLKPDDLVLDVGGWACPFNRANFVLDMEPYETRGFYRTFGGRPFQGPERESFSKHTWITRDICSREPWPFHDKQFDFAICSHTLEDIRDPIGVCYELMRVAKRGYIEVPSPAFELIRDLEHKNMVGLSHHRWITLKNNNTLAFVQKYQFIHGDWRFSFPKSFRNELSSEQSVVSFFWDSHFVACEKVIHGPANQEKIIFDIVKSIRPHNKIFLYLDSVFKKFQRNYARFTGKARRFFFQSGK